MRSHLRALASLWLIAVNIVAACSAPKVEVAKVCPPEDSADYYFPPGALIPTNRDLDLTQRQWLTQRLEAAAEPPLWCGEPRDGYRVLNVGGHSRDTELVSLRRTASGWQGTRIRFALQSNGRTNAYFPERYPIPPPLNTAEINLAMAEAGFWRGNVWQDVRGAEGAAVVIEARVNEDYRVVTRATPSETFLRIAQLIKDKLPPLVH